MHSSTVFERTVVGANRQFEASPGVCGQAQRAAAVQWMLCDMRCLVDRDVHFRCGTGSDSLVLLYGQGIRRLFCSHFELYHFAWYSHDSIQHEVVSFTIIVDNVITDELSREN